MKVLLSEAQDLGNNRRARCDWFAIFWVVLWVFFFISSPFVWTVRLL